MRNLVLFLFLLRVAVPAEAAQSVTVSQLEKMLTAARGTPDARLAHKLSDLELSERLTSITTARLSANLPGPNSRRSLLVLADMSAFLDPPADEIPAVPTPDLNAQRKMIALTVGYVDKTLHRLPDFYATRDTANFRRKVQSATTLQPVRFAGKDSWKVFYSNGEEKVRKGRRPYKTSGMTTNGEFGPILGTVIDDAAKGNLAWSRWEQGAAGLEAVYRFVITDRENSHFIVGGLPAAYRAEIAINPSDGSILRVAFKATPDPGDPLSVADIAVEYGAVSLGARAYICPVKGVALSEGSQFLWLNDVAFKDYHLFGSSMRILPVSSENP